MVFGRRRGRTYSLDAFECLDIREHILEGGEFNQLTLAALIKDALSRNRIKARRAVISFPVKFPWIRVLEMPSVPKKEMGRMVRLEVERLYLDSTVEKLIDYFPLETVYDDEGNAIVKVLSCAMPRNLVLPYVELMVAAGLELVGIDLAETNVLKLAAMQSAEFGDGIALVLNFSLESTDLMVMENNMLQLVRKVGQGKRQIREVLERTLPVDSKARDELGLSDFILPKEHQALTEGYIKGLLDEIRLSVEFYLTDIKKGEGTVKRVVLAGSGYWPANLSELLAMQLHVPLIDLRFENLANVSCQATFRPEFPACGVYAPALGSVLRGVA